MSNTKEVVSTNASAADPQVPSSPTTTFYQQIAGQLGASVSQTVEQIPGYHDDLSALGKRSRRLVTNKFISMTVTAVEASDELTGVKQLDVEQTRDSGQFSEAFQPLVDQLKSLTNRLELMMKAKEVKAGRGALAIYNIAKRLAKDTNNTHLAVHVANLKAELNRKRPARKAKATPPVTPPATPATPAAAVEDAKGGGPTK
jgi:hypothetical protein